MLQARLNDYDFNYVESGHGVDLLFVHGSASDYRTWEQQVISFGEHYHAIAYSRRFHWPNRPISDDEDYSMMQHVDDLESFVRFLGGKPVHVVGHSYGALIGLFLAIRHPALLRTLTLAEPPAITLFVSNSPKPSELLKLLVSKPKTALAIIKLGATGYVPATAACKRNDLDKALDIFGKATLGPDTYEKLSASRRQQARTNLIKSELLGSGFPPLNRKAVARIGIPTLLISAQNSRKLFHYLLDELQDVMPNTVRRMIPEASHIMHEDNLAGYQSAVLSFLREHA